MIVLIDDERSFIEPPEDVLIFRTAAEGIAWLETVTPETVIDQLWFDHDLGTPNGVDKETVMPFLEKLEELCFFGQAPAIGQVVVHTTNPEGGNTIMRSMKRYFPVVRVEAKAYLIATVERTAEDA